MNLIGINQLKAFQIINVSFYFDDVSLTLYTDTEFEITTDIPVNIINVKDSIYDNNFI